MKRIHVVAVALLLGLAAVFGVLAASRTTGLGAASRSHAATASVAVRVRQLDRVELALRRALRDRPPALPPLSAARRSAAVAPRVVYRRPAPIVVIKHALHHDDSTDREAQGGGGDD